MVGEVTFAVIGLLFLIADVRTFSSTFQQTFFGQSNTTLAVMAIAVFATSFLGPRRQMELLLTIAWYNCVVRIILPLEIEKEPWFVRQ